MVNMRAAAARLAYGLLFWAAVPAGLVAWALAARRNVPLTAVRSPAGGGAAAWLKATTCSMCRFSLSGALRSVDMTIGAPDRCETLCSAIASYIALARTHLRQTCVPPTIDTDQGKHQPLQWNIGSVHR